MTDAKQNETSIFAFDREPVELDSKPTKHPPGSPEKIEVLRERFEKNLFLYHPCDNKELRPRAGR
ncbi:MAG: hypothetical protein ACK5YR_12375 [Pirellula sp.]